jgi:hypothetical protein
MKKDPHLLDSAKRIWVSRGYDGRHDNGLFLTNGNGTTMEILHLHGTSEFLLVVGRDGFTLTLASLCSLYKLRRGYNTVA